VDVDVDVDVDGADYYNRGMIPWFDGHLPFDDVAVASTDLLLLDCRVVVLVLMVSSWEEEEDSRDLAPFAEEEVVVAAAAAAAVVVVPPRWNRHPARLGKDLASVDRRSDFHPPC
jgi:hypothetical protein